MIILILAPLVDVLSTLLLAYGAWLIYPPAGFVITGALCLFWPWLVARYLDCTQLPVGRDKQYFSRDYSNEEMVRR